MRQVSLESRGKKGSKGDSGGLMSDWPPYWYCVVLVVRFRQDCGVRPLFMRADVVVVEVRV